MAAGCSWLCSGRCHDQRELFDIPALSAFPATTSSYGQMGAGAGPARGLGSCFPGSVGLGQPGLGWSCGEAEQGWARREAASLVLSLCTASLHHCSPLFTSPGDSAGTECLGPCPWDGTLAASLAPAPCPLLPMPPGPACRRGFPKRLQNVQGICPPLARHGAPACTEPSRKAVMAAEERPLQTVCPRAGSGGCSWLTPLSASPPSTVLRKAFPFPGASQPCTSLLCGTGMGTRARQALQEGIPSLQPYLKHQSSVLSWTHHPGGPSSPTQGDSRMESREGMAEQCIWHCAGPDPLGPPRWCGTHLPFCIPAKSWHVTLPALAGQAGHTCGAQGCAGCAWSRARRRKDAVCFSIFSPPPPTSPPFLPSILPSVLG